MAIGLLLGLAVAVLGVPMTAPVAVPVDPPPSWCPADLGPAPLLSPCQPGFEGVSGGSTGREATATAPPATTQPEPPTSTVGLPAAAAPSPATAPGSSTSTTSAVAPPPPRRTATAPGAAALNVLDLGAVGDGQTDDSEALQDILDRAAPGSVIYFPDVSPRHYRLSQTLHIRKPLTLLGAPGDARSELRQTTSGRNGLQIHASGVTVERLKLIGPGYTTFAGDSAIYIDATDAHRLGALNVFDNRMQGWSNSAVRWSFVNDFIIDGNSIEDCTYAGVLVISGFRGRISNNSVTDIGAPTSGDPLANAYSISVTSEADAPYSKNVIVDHNVITKNPIWSGIMNHGGSRVLIDSNVVRDADVALANTWVPGSTEGSDDTLFINNVASGSPRNSLWLTGADDRPTRRARVIGNQFDDSASLVVYNQEQATIAWNRATGTTGPHGALRTRLTNRSLTVAGNDWGGATTTGDGAVLTYAPPDGAPPAPTQLAARRIGAQVVIRWRYDRSIRHDSFLIEHRSPGGSWQPLAYRPPNDGTWDFDAPANAAWARFDPLLHLVPGDQLRGRQELRIRAQLGAAVSAWADAATVSP